MTAFDYAVTYLQHPAEPPLCACGCGKRVKGQWGGIKKGWSRYNSGHDSSWRQNVAKVQQWKSNISKASIERKRSGNYVHPFKGHTKHTHPGLLSSSIKLKGNTIGADHRSKISDSLKRKYACQECAPWNKGKTKEDHPSLLQLSVTNSGKTHSEETKQKIRDKTIQQHKQHPYSPERCEFHRQVALSLSRDGRLYAQSDEGKKRLAAALTQRNLEGKMAKHVQPTSPEKLIMNWFVYDVVYSGNGSYWVAFDDRYKNPDFYVADNKDKIIEVFGRYWHDETEEHQLIQKYANVGKKCIVLWQDDIEQQPTKVKQRIIEFITEE